MDVDVVKHARQLFKREYFTPLNLREAEATFMADAQNEPQFVYPPFPRDEIKQALDKPQSQETEYKLQLLLARDTPQISAWTAKLFEVSFKPDYLAAAQNDAKLPGQFTPQSTATAEDAAHLVREYLAKNDLNDWEVVVTDQHDFFFRVLAKHKKVLVSEVVNWDFCDLDNTLAHEIDGHVFRAVNMHAQTDPAYRHPLPFYLKTEEGLASFMGDYLSTTGKLSRKHHALKYLAGHFALTHGFRDTYNLLLDSGFTPAIAFRRTFRLKRGLEDTSQPGCNCKEAMYYEGMLEVKEYLDHGGDVKKLFTGKVGLADLSHVPIPDGIKIPKRIYRYQRQ